jgi:hypothetical protein
MQPISAINYIWLECEVYFSEEKIWNGPRKTLTPGGGGRRSYVQEVKPGPGMYELSWPARSPRSAGNLENPTLHTQKSMTDELWGGETGKWENGKNRGNPDDCDK